MIRNVLFVLFSDLGSHVRCVQGWLTSVNLANMLYNAQEIINARSTQLLAISRIPTLTSRRVGKHIQLQGELHFGADLGCSSITTALLKFKSLQHPTS